MGAVLLLEMQRLSIRSIDNNQPVQDLQQGRCIIGAEAISVRFVQIGHYPRPQQYSQRFCIRDFRAQSENIDCVFLPIIIGVVIAVFQQSIEQLLL
ncbi:hypothetical protein SDC9_107393 [bioreactor metagenome]|uniref:Uncharacterized protein n=1 Tax=bioreactor metagenome TaxID=1076179 RepID=A0A645B538_9ZZZZ